MSLKNRARYLAAQVGVSYQQALNFIREIGARPAKLAESNGWPLARADVFCFEDHAAMAAHARYVQVSECQNCGDEYYLGSDKKGVLIDEDSSECFCPACVEESGTQECMKCGSEMLGRTSGSRCFLCAHEE